MDKSISGAVAAAHSVAVAGWRRVFEQAVDRIAVRFTRIEPRLTARDMLLGLLSPVERKNCWWLAEQAGHHRPARMQRLLRDVVWDAEAVRDDLRAFVVEHLYHPDAILIVDETEFLKRATDRSECNASTAARPDGSRTARSRCSCRMPPRTGER